MNGKWLILAVIIGGGMLVHQAVEVSGEVSAGEATDWKWYSSPIAGFEIRYPADVSFEERELTGEAIMGSMLPPATINYMVSFYFSEDKKQSVNVASARHFEEGYGFNAQAMSKHLAEMTGRPAKTSKVSVGESLVGYKTEPQALPSLESTLVFFVFLDGEVPGSAYSITVGVDSTREPIVEKMLGTFAFREEKRQ